MKSIIQELSETKQLLDDIKPASSKPETKVQETEINRIEQKELYQLYVSDPLVFNSINKQVQIIMSAGYDLEGSEKSINFFEGFIERIGEQGTENDFDQILSETFLHELTGGRAWHENIHNSAGTKIVDIDIINPLGMDYARDASGKIVFDNEGNPVGYVQKVPFNFSQDQKFKVPDKVNTSNGIFIPPKYITHFKLYTVGDGLSGLGLVEPIYKSALRKLNIEQGYANAAHRLGYPIVTATIGDALHEPTTQQITNTLNEINQIDYKSSFAFPYYVKMDLLEARKPERLKDNLDYFENSEMTGMGTPGAFATGRGEDTNRATLNRQEYILKLSLKDFIKRTIKTIENKEFAVIAAQNGLFTEDKKPDFPRIKWREISMEDLDGKAKRLMGYSQYGLLTPNPELEDYIRTIEDLPKQVK